MQNLAVYAGLFILASMIIGFLLAVFIDQKVSAEGVLRTIFLYPYAMSFVATGLVWQWILTPGSGIESTVRQLGFPDFYFDWIIDQDMVIYTIVLATVWQASGLVMALMLAGLRGIDDEIWKAARLDGIPTWRVYVSIVIPMMAPTIATVFLLLSTAAIKLFDSVVAMTQGGPSLILLENISNSIIKIEAEIFLGRIYLIEGKIQKARESIFKSLCEAWNSQQESLFIDALLELSKLEIEFGNKNWAKLTFLSIKNHKNCSYWQQFESQKLIQKYLVRKKIAIPTIQQQFQEMIEPSL